GILARRARADRRAPGDPRLAARRPRAEATCGHPREPPRPPAPAGRRPAMSAVVDASVLVAATVDGGRDGAWAEEVIDAGHLVAPDLVLVEATNILRRLERARSLTRLEATAAQRDLLRLDVELAPFEPFAERIW